MEIIVSPYFAIFVDFLDKTASAFSDFAGRIVTEALVRFLFEFRRRQLGAATGTFGLSASCSLLSSSGFPRRARGRRQLGAGCLGSRSSGDFCSGRRRRRSVVPGRRGGISPPVARGSSWSGASARSFAGKHSLRVEEAALRSAY